jgi:hypothetical protein
VSLPFAIRYSLFAFLIITLTACSPKTFGQPNKITLKDGKLHASNEWVLLSFEIARSFIGLAIKNLAPEPIKVLWEEWNLIDPQGFSHRVLHKNVTFLTRGNPQLPSIIPSGGVLSDMIIPEENIRYSPVLRSITLDPLFLKTAKKGDTFTLIAVFERNGEKKTSVFEFVVQ